jgi:transposase
MRTRRFISGEELARMREARASGAEYRAIARRFGVALSTAYKLIGAPKCRKSTSLKS